MMDKQHWELGRKGERAAASVGQQHLYLKDTVTADEEDDKVEADDHAREVWASISRDPVIHHNIPVLSCENL